MALFTLVDGMRTGAYTGAKVGDYIGGDRRDFVGARAVVNGNDRADLIAGYAQEYLGRVGSLKGSQGQAQTPKVPSPTQPTSTGTQVVHKGTKLIVTIGDAVFEYYHQGTRHTSNGRTVLSAQGIRWVLNRRPRTKTREDLSLKDLAIQVTKAHGLTLDWQATVNPEYSHISQLGISDYQLLLREAKAAGLWVSENGASLVVKDLKNLADTEVILKPGHNLVSYTIADVPLDGSKEAGTSLAPLEPKAKVEPLTGQLANLKPDVDPAKSHDVTGKKASEPKGTQKPGTEAATQASASRYKRVQGLPSTFVVPLSTEMLDLVPLCVVRTQGLSGTLSRAWVVDKVTHKSDGTTTLDVYSPVEVLDLSPPPTAAPGIQGPVALKPGGFIAPVKGFPITSLVGYRVHPVTGANRMHAGTDVGCPGGTPLVASISGTMKHYGFNEGGYGVYCEIIGDNGWSCLYAHLTSIDVPHGAKVQQGQRMATSGNTGIGTGDHLHFEIRSGDEIKKPEDVGLKGGLGDVW